MLIVIHLVQHANKIANTGSDKHSTPNFGNFNNMDKINTNRKSNEKSNSNADVGIRSGVPNHSSGPLKSTAAFKMLKRSMYISTRINNSSSISATAPHSIAIKQSSNDIDSNMLLALAQAIEEQERQNQNCPDAWTCCYCDAICCQHCDEYCVNFKTVYYLVLNLIFDHFLVDMIHIL